MQQKGQLRVKTKNELLFILIAKRISISLEDRKWISDKNVSRNTFKRKNWLKPIMNFEIYEPILFSIKTGLNYQI